MHLNNIMDDEKTESRTMADILGCEKRIKNLVADFFGYARAIVLYQSFNFSAALLFFYYFPS